MNVPIGLYLHIPFCRSKCPYCDFYSMRGNAAQTNAYAAALCRKISESAEALQRKADSLYIGGGTPSVLGAEGLKALVIQAKTDFLTEDAEITVECNPYGLSPAFFAILAEAGVNRISLGLQSAVDSERRILGRLSDADTVRAAVLAAQKAGILNISLDVMLGIPHQTTQTLAETLDFCLSLGVPHLSAYILKIEAGTLFEKRRDTLELPDDDQTADLYLQLCETLKQNGILQNGILQYEISNFARPGFESRHNLKYWHCEEYLGLGPSAHSFLNGRRFYYPRDLQGFLDGKPPVPDGTGGDFTEYAMLALRLCEGLSEKNVQTRFGHGIPQEMRSRAVPLAAHGLLVSDESGIRLTRTGFLVSNAVLAELLDCIE